jgi:putative ABC transport system permease protein
MVRGLVASMPPAQRLTLPHIASLSLDGQALAISLALTILASLIFGLIPAWRTARTDRLQSTRGVAGLGVRELRLQSAFVVVQVALALLLLAGAGLMAQSLRRLLDVSPGFRTDHLLTMTVALPQGKYKDAPAVASFHEVLTDRMAAVPGVLGASINDQLPLGGAGNNGSFTVVGDSSAKETVTLVRSVAANYFDVMGIRLEEGRRFAPADTPSSPAVVLVNRIVVERAGVPLLGKRVVFPFMPGQEMEVVGIVGNEQYDAIDRAPQPVLYFPQSQGPSTNFTLLLRTAGDPAGMIPSVVAAVAELDPSIPVYQRMSMEDILGRSEAVFRRRSVLALIGGFAASALLLAAVGLYGVLTQTVAQRTREIGVRVALGAGRAEIAGEVLRRGLAPVGIGIATGLAGSLALGRYLGGLLYGTSATDPLTLSVVAAALAVTALAACVIPARRALRVNPVDALRG